MSWVEFREENKVLGLCIKLKIPTRVFLVDAYCMWDRKAILIGEEMGRVLSLLILRRLSGHGFYLLFVTRVFVKNSRCVVSCVGV